MRREQHLSPLLTEQEAAAWLRLTEPGGPKHPEATIKRYRDLGLLRCVRVGRQARYHVRDLEKLIDRLRQQAER